MMGYIIFASITNFCLGYLLLRYCASPVAEAAAAAADPLSGYEAILTMLEAPETSSEPSLLGGEQSPPNREDYAPIDASTALPVPSKSAALRPAAAEPKPNHWLAEGEQLTALRERFEYARRVADKRLCQEVAVQLRERTRGWHTEFQTDLGPGDAHFACREMCLAQLESTLSNLESFDWSVDDDVVFKNLAREFHAVEHALNQLRKLSGDLPLETSAGRHGS